MTHAPRGAASRLVAPDIDARLTADLRALVEARQPTKRAAAALLAALLNPATDTGELQSLAWEVHVAAGRLWEALAHTNEA